MISQTILPGYKKKVSLVTFFTYCYSSDENVLTAEKAFVSLALFDIIRMPLALLPLLIGDFLF